MRSVPFVVLGLIGLVCSIGQELYRRIWGTVGLIAASAGLAVLLLILLCVGRLSWRLAHIGPPILCLAGTVVLWRERPTANESYIVPGDVRKFIPLLESDLRRIEPETPFHIALGRGFDRQVEQAAGWLASVYNDGAEDFEVTALFVEMERFDINTDQWHLSGFTFNMPVGELFEDLEYNLAEYENMCEEEFVLTGMEDLQAAFKQASEGELFASEAPEDQHALQAMGVAFDLITVRMVELLSEAHREAGRRGHPVGGVRVFVKVHDSMLPPVCCPGYKT